jgi:sporulation protein YlmC with PRC-barrel domain
MEPSMMKVAGAAAALSLLSFSALAQGAAPATALETKIPSNSVTVTDWYKQSVYDRNDNKIGEIMDVLVDSKNGQVTTLIVGVGGFLGAGEKDIAAPLSAVKVTNKNNNKWYLVMDTTKDALKSAPGFKYDRDATTWVPDNK